MSIAARTETAEQRTAIYAALTQRNRLIGLVRIGLPIIGAIVLLGLLVQLYIGSLIPAFGFANIVIDRNNLMVETPSYSGVGADGTIYTIAASSAKAAIGNTDLINLDAATFSLKQPSGASFGAVADAARLRLSDQVVNVDGLTHVEGSNGMKGTVANAEIEVGTERMKSSGAVDFTFSGGSTLKADSMTFDNKALLWQFSNVTIKLTGTPGEAQKPATVVDLRPGGDFIAREVTP